MRLGLIVKFILIAGVFGGLWIWFGNQNTYKTPVFTNKVEDTSVKSYGGESPSITPVGTTEVILTLVTTSPSINVPEVKIQDLSSDQLPLKQAFAAKYSKDISSIFVNIESQVDDFIKGSVDFDNSGYAATFYAVKSDNSSWNIIAVENGVISCSIIDPYSVPSSLIPQCYSYSSGTVVNR